MKPQAKPLAPLLLRSLKRCPKCDRVLDGRADRISAELYHTCFRCLHPDTQQQNVKWRLRP